MNESLETFGPGIWKAIHRVAYLNYRGKLDREKTNNMIEEIITYIPCQRCIDKSNNYHNRMKYNRDMFEAWWKHHNDVNRSKSKYELSYHEAIAKTRLKAESYEIPGLEHIFFETRNSQLARIIAKML